MEPTVPAQIRTIADQLDSVRMEAGGAMVHHIDAAVTALRALAEKAEEPAQKEESPKREMPKSGTQAAPHRAQPSGAAGKAAESLSSGRI